MRFAIMLEPQQGLTYLEQLAVAQRAEAAGFEGFFRSDHYQSFPGPDDLPTTDAWTVLAGIARETTSIRLGRARFAGDLPPAWQPRQGRDDRRRDERRPGRGWLSAPAGTSTSTLASGFPFPPIAERADLLEETLEILHGLWDEPDGWSYAGRHWQVVDARFRPKPVQRPHPPIIVGGSGTPRGMRIAARYADEFNMTDTDPAQIAHWYAALDAACLAIGRDPRSIRRSLMIGTLIGATEAELAGRKAAIVSSFALEDDGQAWFARREKKWIIGTPEQARAKVAELAGLGVERLMLQDFVPRDLAMIELLGREVVAGG